MNLLKKIICYKKIFLVFFILLHIFLFNINVAEWGDSYRILRASEFIRKGVYPDDEKRLPLFSLILAARPNSVDPILWGRIILFVFSVFSFLIFEKILRQFIKEQKYINLGLILFILNPVYLYWSIRIMADIPFAFFVLLAFYLLSIWKDHLTVGRGIILGLLSGFSLLIRFEGYILFGCIGLSLILTRFSEIKDTFKNIKKNILVIISFVLTNLAILTPYLLYRNPLDSKYFGETASRAYDFKMVSTYVLSFLFAFGFTSFLFFLIKNYKENMNIVKANISLLLFIVLEMILILFWPAAIPRLFVPVIPFFILFLVLSIKNYFEDTKEDEEKKKEKTIFIINILICIFLLVLFIFGQYMLRLQFLLPSKYILAGVSLIQLLNIFFILKKKYIPFLITLTLSLSVWSISTIYLHKNIFIAVKNAGEYVYNNMTGEFVYNDISSVSDWYINQKGKDNLHGFYYNFESDKKMSFDALNDLDIDYMVITNEHNTTMEIDLSKRSYLTLVKEFSYNINGEEFFSKIVKFNKDYTK